MFSESQLLPQWPEFIHVVTLQDYNTRIVVFGTVLLGLVAGMVGTFILLRKRSLLGDAISHATLPGIGLAFIISTHFQGTGKSISVLLLGALISGIVGMSLILLIRNLTRIKEDAALGIVLSVFFGLGISILGLIQKMSTGHAAGLESFVYGKTASMLASDAKLIAVVAVLVMACCCLLYKELTILCFDQNYAASQRWPVVVLDGILMMMVVTVTVIGLQAVGLILVIALLIIPAAAARFWSNRLHLITILAALFGALSGLFGTLASGLVPKLPTGPIIVVSAAGLFAISLFFGSARGLIRRIYLHQKLSRTVGIQHLMRAFYECCEISGTTIPTGSTIDPKIERRDVTWPELLRMRSWSPRKLRSVLRNAKKQCLITEHDPNHFRMTESGLIDARRIVRNHRLWELYLITHADIAPSKVDRDADQIEHVLGKAMVHRLESLLLAEQPERQIPVSPH